MDRTVNVPEYLHKAQHCTVVHLYIWNVQFLGCDDDILEPTVALRSFQSEYWIGQLMYTGVHSSGLLPEMDKYKFCPLSGQQVAAQKNCV